MNSNNSSTAIDNIFLYNSTINLPATLSTINALSDHNAEILTIKNG